MSVAHRDAPASHPEEQYKGEAIQRAARALACFSPKRPVWTVEDLARATGTPKETLRGILNTLAAHNLLRQRERDGYSLGFAWLRIGSLFQNQFDTRAVAIPLMRRIREAINETVILSVLVGDQRVHIDFLESTHAMRRVAHVGTSGPLHVGATGLALLSVLPPQEATAYLERAKLWLSASEIKKLERSLTTIHKDGYASALGSVNVEMGALASAVRLYSGECVAITVSSPVERLTPELKQQSILLLKEAIQELSTKLGARP